jgi:hypothetical protein
LQWFDRPKEDLVRYYGDYFKDEFWNQAAFRKNFTEEFAKNTAGSKIKTL